MTTAVALVVLVALCGCSTRRIWTNPRRTARQQVLVSEAVDQALHTLAWPPVENRSVRVEVASIGETRDDHYMRGAVEAALLERGARLSGRRGRADLTVMVLSGVVGIERKQILLGIPELENAILTLPELALYSSTRERGLAKVQLVVRDTKSGRLVGTSSPTTGETYIRHRKILFFGKRETNTSLDPDTL